jgi:hypothetical protein
MADYKAPSRVVATQLQCHRSHEVINMPIYSFMCAAELLLVCTGDTHGKQQRFAAEQQSAR